MSISIPLRPEKLLQTAMHEHEHELETGSPSKSHKRRWRLAFMAISFARALRFLAKNVHENKANLLRSLSYVAVDVQPSADDNDKPAGNVDPKDLADIVRTKNFDALMSQYGGVKRLVETLGTDVKNGINSTDSDLMRRKNIFGANEYQKQPVKGFLPSVFDALQKIVIIVVLGMKQPGSQDQGWFDVDGISIILVVSILLAFSAASNFRRSRALAQKLSRNSSSSSDMNVNVTRNGQALTISIFDVVVGDVVNLKIGDQIPADGLFLEGHSLKVDESCLTGESDHVEINAASNPFMLSDTKVVEGAGTMVVTSVGMNTAWGEIMSSVVLCGDDDEVTPLQTRLKQLTSFIQKVGLYVTALILVGSMICYIIRHKTVENGCGQKEYGVGSSKTKFDDVINSVVGIVAAAMAIIVVGIPDGLHLAVTLTEVYSMRRMMKDDAVVRNLTACETMGSTTMLCITLNEMKVTEVWLGKEPLYEDGVSSRMPPTASISILRESIGLNTAGGVYKPTPDTTPEISGSPTDKAMMSWAVFSLGLDIDELKTRCEIIQVEASNSEKKMSGVLFRRKHKRTLHECHWKGAAEIVLAMCSNYYDRDGVIRPINKEERKCIETDIQNMAAKGLRCLAFAHKKIEREQGQINSEKMEESGLTLLALAGLTNPCGPGVKAVVDTCIAAGVGIKMVTDDDNVHTARAMAVECGILKPEHDDVLESREAVIEGVQFRNLSPEEQKRKVEKIRVMARSSPFDKLLMVESLKRKGHHVVAFIGDERNDAPALKEAHVGISMGLFQGPEVANEISDILILNDNINSVVTILEWGRCVDENIQKFIQFQLTMNLAALIFTFVVSMSHDKVPLTAVQLLWVNLIMDVLAALALATEKPAEELMKKPPVGRKEPLITRIMWRNLIAHALFQVTVLVTLQFKGRSIFGVNEKVKNALIFNTFVQCQVFNEFNARKLETKNIFKGIRNNKLFLGIVGITILFQVLTMEFLNKFASNERLNWGQWGASVGIATLSWPIGWIVKCIPVSGNRVMTRYQDLLAKEF